MGSGSGDGPAVVRIARRANASTRDAWERYAAHRARVLRLVPEVDEGASLLVIGAGNLNDLDLDALAARFATITLADLDVAAVRAGLERFSAETRARCRVAEADASGVADDLLGYRERAPRPESLEARVKSLGPSLAAQLGTHEVVLSAGVQSQLASACKEVLGASHPALNAVASAAGRAHLWALVALARPGGVVALGIDCVSSDGHPVVELCAQSDPATALGSFAARGACYPGTHPEFVQSALLATGRVGSIGKKGAWLWPVTEQRTLLTYGLVVRCR